MLSLGSIIWNFFSLTMQFEYLGHHHTLQGIILGGIHLLSNSQLSKCLSIDGQGPYPLLLTTSEHIGLTLSNSKLQPDMQVLLSEFEDVFQSPIGLPPTRLEDHIIHLVDEGKVVRVRLYRYPVIQNGEIEKLIQEMKQVGIIRDSNSPFASPMVMVKKKDESWRLCIDCRWLNQLTIKDKFPIPVTDELLDELGQATVFSKLDLRSRSTKFECGTRHPKNNFQNS